MKLISIIDYFFLLMFNYLDGGREKVYWRIYFGVEGCGKGVVVG